MNAERLLAHYERIADAPDAIGCLRQFILDLAVRGKLVPQDSNDEPASILLRQIALSKQRQLKARTIKQEVQLPTIGASEQPFNIPVNWEWIRLNDLTELVYGKLLPTSELLDEGYDVFGANGIIGKYSRYLYKDSMLLISCRGAYSGTPNISPPKCYVTNNSIVCEFFDPSSLNIRFIHSVISISSRESVVTGTAQPQVTIANAIKLPLPLPPLAEQHRIVAKVDELMALCDRLEAARAEREATRDRLAASTLARLNAPDPATFEADARFALNTIPALTTRPDQIKQLRQTILNLAVRGRLVPQDLRDEPISELLKLIAKEKARLVKAGEIRTPKAMPPNAEIPFPIPATWRWSQIAEIGILNPRNEAPDTKRASFVPMPLISAEYGVANGHDIRSWGEIKKGYTHFSEGDVGLAKITPCFENGKSAVFRHLTGGIGSGTTELHIVRPLFVNADYILLFLKTPHFIETGIPKMTGTAGQKRVSAEYFANSPFPLPPLAEQHRIVAKVDALMKICDELEASLGHTAITRRNLLDALLAEALTPVQSREREAAE